MVLTLSPKESIEKFIALGGGKASNMARMSQMNLPIPRWFCVTTKAFLEFLDANDIKEQLQPTDDLESFAKNVEELFSNAKMPPHIQEQIVKQLEEHNLTDQFVAVRSSGLDEDSDNHSFAGQFATFLFQKGTDQVIDSIKRCWASGYSARGLHYRKENHLPMNDIQVGVVVQQMINADASGVVFSKNPVNPLDTDHVVVSSVYGIGEGLVSGELDADHFLFNKGKKEVESHPTKKLFSLKQDPKGGLFKQQVDEHLQDPPSLSDEQVELIAKLAINLEEELGMSQDCEWAISNGELFYLQTRPITTLPPLEFYDKSINGQQAILWDNSNIIESYAGITTPLTFTFASNAYHRVYIQFCEIIGIPNEVIADYDPVFRNMLGIVRGRIYYNLINWYKLVSLLPGSGSNGDFMETMMGVKQKLKPEAAELFNFEGHQYHYSLAHKLKLLTVTGYRFLNIDRIVTNFHNDFNSIYDEARQKDFENMSLPELAAYYQSLDDRILRKWQAPIINDCLCMVFFGLLKKLTQKWLASGDEAVSLQNDLLCGEGELESTEPTKTLMRIAAYIDSIDEIFREWFIQTPAKEVWDGLSEERRDHQVFSMIQGFLDKYGFRCVNELKLEENDLHDDPSFVINAIASYVKTKSYDIEAMEQREQEIRKKAESVVKSKLSGLKLKLFMWITKQARRAIKNRENLRFCRTKIFGVVRHIFRGMGIQLHKLKLIENPRDVFYLTLQELVAFIEGRSIDDAFITTIERRKHQFDEYKNTPTPPDRFATYGTAGESFKYPQILMSGDLLVSETKVSDDPSLLTGTPCCPGIVEGVVRVVKDLKDADGIDGHILVTERTDPGWVPLYPSCSALLIERGSLLSHSAVVARELGLPTIVGITGGLTEKLSSGQRVRVDAGKGEIKILEE